MRDAQEQLRTTRALPPERVAEIEDVIAFLAAREEAQSLTGIAAAAGTTAFAAIWDNPDDDVCDNLFSAASSCNYVSLKQSVTNSCAAAVFRRYRRFGRWQRRPRWRLRIKANRRLPRPMRKVDGVGIEEKLILG